jgi:hypothetical protein
MFMESGKFQLPDGCKIILPIAPKRKIPEYPLSVHQWFDTRTFDEKIDEITPTFLTKKYNQEEIQDSCTILRGLVQREADLLGDTKKVFVGGFS